MAGTVDIDRQDDITVFTIRNQKKRNALDVGICMRLATAVGALRAEGVRAAVLTAVGDEAFCSGFDLRALPDGEHAPALAERAFDSLIEAIAVSYTPIIAALNGHAFGGGLELAATCDIRVAHPGVQMAMPPARLGIVYAPRGLARFVSLIGDARARELFLTARTVGAEEAYRWGLLNHLETREQVLPLAETMARRIAQLAPLAVQGMRRSFEALQRGSRQLSVEDAAMIERERLGSWTSADHQEALVAFAQKRKPEFRGR